LDRIVKTCLAKDPDERWQSAHDLMKQLSWIAEGSSSSVAPVSISLPKRRILLPWIAAAVFLLIAAMSLLFHFLHPAAQQTVMRLSISPPPDTVLVDAPVISPDGSRIVIPAADKNSQVNLWVRALDSLNFQKIPGTEGAHYPFWSGDSRFI